MCAISIEMYFSDGIKNIEQYHNVEINIFFFYICYGVSYTCKTEKYYVHNCDLTPKFIILNIFVLT